MASGNYGKRVKVKCHTNLIINNQLYFAKGQVYKCICNFNDESDVKFKVENDGIQFHCDHTNLSKYFVFVENKDG